MTDGAAVWWADQHRHARRFLLIALCVWGGCLAIRGAADGLFEVRRPALAAAFWPASAEALANLAQARIVAAGGSVDATARALSTAALQRSPASATPLVLAGLAASERGDMATAESLMLAARARDPRDATVCYWLLDHFVRNGRYAAAMAQVGGAIRLRDGAAAPVFALVATLAAIPAAREAVRAELATDPFWRNGFFQGQATVADPASLLALLQSIPPARDPAAARLERQAVLRAMVDRGAYASAYAAWLAFLPPAQRPMPGAVYDPDFAGLEGPPPFNWRLQTGDDTAVAIGTHGLSIAYAGEQAAVLAEQYLVVPPGAYRLSIAARGHGASDRLVTRVVCARDASVLASIPASTSQSTNVAISPRCGAVQLQIAAESRIPRETAQAIISTIRLAPG